MMKRLVRSSTNVVKHLEKFGKNVNCSNINNNKICLSKQYRPRSKVKFCSIHCLSLIK